MRGGDAADVPEWALKELPHAAATCAWDLLIQTADILNLHHAELSTLLNYELDPASGQVAIYFEVS